MNSIQSQQNLSMVVLADVVALNSVASLLGIF